MVGDGFCNDKTNIEICNHDGGDCCLKFVNKDRCSECKCYLKDICATGFHPLVGNGYCNDVTNNQQCNFDGGDCCVNVNTDYCSNCSCFGSGVITSPGYPGNYDNNLDLTWLIQFPLGQLIEINFVDFNVEDESSCK